MRAVILKALAASMFWALVASSSLGDGFVFFSVSGENRIAVYEQDRKSGRLSFSSEIKTDGSPKALALSPDGKSIFTTLLNDGGLASFSVDPSSGTLKQLSSSPVAAHGSFLQVDKSGRFLLSSYYGTGQVMVHSIDGGQLGGAPSQTISTDERAHSIIVDPSNRFAFVSHTRPNSIHQFRLDLEGGLLLPGSEPILKRETVAGPRHLRFGSNGKFAYGSDEQGLSVTTYRFDAAKGTLQPIQQMSTFPKDVTQGSTSDIRVHPSGRFVYVINRSFDTIAVFEVGQGKGTLSFVERVECEPLSRSCAFSDDGRFLYSASSRNGKVAVYGVNGRNGKLDRIDTVDVGPGIWWVCFLDKD